MIVSGYRVKIFRPECNPNFQSVHCIADLESDIREVLPYLNTVLGGSTYTQDPPSVTFKVHGKLITVHSRQIAINALKDEEEADKILKWLMQEINDAWEKRAQIKPCFQGVSKPKILEILKLLPRNNCRHCARPPAWSFRSCWPRGPKDRKIVLNCAIPTEPSCGSTSNHSRRSRNSSAGKRCNLSSYVSVL